MKTLLLMRHAKSSWSDAGLQDTERPLNKRGEKDAPRMGKLIRDEKLCPDSILSSTAVRAARTAQIVAEKCGYGGEIQLLDELYMAEPPVYIAALKALPDEVQTVLVVGHNPGLEGLLQLLVAKVESLPTGAIAHIQVPVRTWQAFDLTIDCRLLDLWRPRDL